MTKITSTMKIENGVFYNGYETIPINQITQAGICTTDIATTEDERVEFRRKKLKEYQPKKKRQRKYLTIGLLLCFVVFSVVSAVNVRNVYGFIDAITTWSILAVFLWLFIAFLIWLREPWEVPQTVIGWGIKITTAAGTTEVFFSRNKNFIEGVLALFQDAMRAAAEGRHANASWNVNNYHIDKVEYQDYSDNSVTNNITNEYVNNTYEGISPDEMKFLLGEFSQQMESVAKAINNSNNELLSTTFAELKAELKNEKPSPKGIKGCLDRLRSASEGMDIYENVDKLIEHGARAIMMFTV